MSASDIILAANYLVLVYFLLINGVYAVLYGISFFEDYTWRSWNAPKSHERKKQSYYIMQKAFENKKLDPIP